MKKILLALTLFFAVTTINAAEKSTTRSAPKSDKVVKSKTVKKTAVATAAQKKQPPLTVDFELSCGSFYGAQYTPGTGASWEQIFAEWDAYAQFLQMFFCGVPGNPTWTNL